MHPHFYCISDRMLHATARRGLRDTGLNKREYTRLIHLMLLARSDDDLLRSMVAVGLPNYRKWAARAASAMQRGDLTAVEDYRVRMDRLYTTVMGHADSDQEWETCL